MVTVGVGAGGVPVGRGGGADLPGAGQTSAVEEDGQVDDVPHVVVSVDVGVSEDAVQVLVDGFDDDVRVAGKNGDEGSFGEQHPHLEDKRPRTVTLQSVGPGPGPGVTGPWIQQSFLSVPAHRGQ